MHSWRRSARGCVPTYQSLYQFRTSRHVSTISPPNTTTISTQLYPANTVLSLNNSPCIPYSRFEVIEDCRKFKECSPIGVLVTKICPFDYFYDTSKTQCVNKESTECGERPRRPQNFHRDQKLLSFKELLH
ncbi:hypothetical protein B566_EDAN000961 [Ephemera danica]|nr:hypothetical protein B566_EDAN000961 [Ephemera danica]